MKIIIMMFYFMIGLLIITGCSTSLVEPSNNQQDSQKVVDSDLKNRESIYVVEHISYGYFDPDIGNIDPSEDCFQLSPNKDSPYNTKTIIIDKNEVVMQAIEAHKDDPSYEKEVCTIDGNGCETETGWMTVSINGKNIEFAREEVKKIKFNTGYVMYFVAADIEEQPRASDICIRLE